MSNVPTGTLLITLRNPTRNLVICIDEEDDITLPRSSALPLHDCQRKSHKDYDPDNNAYDRRTETPHKYYKIAIDVVKII